MGLYVFSYQLWKSTFDASVYLTKEVLSKLKGTAEVYMGLLNQVIELLLHCSRTVQIFKDYNKELEINHVISPAFHEVSNFMEEYVANALGGPFGSSLKGLLWSLSQAESEIKVDKSRCDIVILMKCKGVKIRMTVHCSPK